MEYVERFRAGSKDIHSCDIGKYVRFSDYQRVAFKFQEYFEAWKDLRRRNAELERELADIKESYRNVLAEPCESDDRVHCTCVPALKAEIKRLRKIVEEHDYRQNHHSYDLD